MIYHAFNGKSWRVFSAISTDSGDTWSRQGLLLEGDSTRDDSFDFMGIGTRAIAPHPHPHRGSSSSSSGTGGDGRGRLLMVYEGVDQNMKHSLGAAFCVDEGGGGPWVKIEGNDDEGEDWVRQPGGPIAQPGVGAMGEWTKQVIGTPCIVPMEDGSLRLYHCGKSGSEASMSIGLIISESGDVGPDSWSPAAALSINGKEEDQSLIHVAQDVGGLTDSEWKRITGRFPEIESYDADNCRECLTKIQNRLSINQRDLKKKIILRLPQVLGYDYDTDIGPELTLVQKGLSLTDEELTSLVMKCPQIIGLGYEEVVRPRIEALQADDDDGDGLDLVGVKDVILQKPAALALPVRGAASKK